MSDSAKPEPLPLRKLMVPLTLPVQTCQAEDCRTYFTVLVIFPPQGAEGTAAWDTGRAAACPFCGRELTD